MDKISVIVPFGNNAKTLQRCIESILDQTYTCFELIAVSDGACDGSDEIIKEYALMDSRVTLLKISHSGVSCARNAGLEYASGDYIQFIDADDYVEPDMWSKMLSAMERENAGICSCAFTHPCFATYAGDAVFNTSDIDDMLRYYQHTFAGHVPWNKLYKKSVITDKFIEGLNFSEDGMFGISNMFNTQKIVCISDKLYHYCVAPPSKTEKSQISKMADGNFWDKKASIWYQRDLLLETSRKIFEKHLPADRIDDFLYIRIFDFLIWETAIYCQTGVERAGLEKEIFNVTGERDFIRCIKHKEKYGVRMKKMTVGERFAAVQRFVAICSCESGEPFFVCLDAFVKEFCEHIPGCSLSEIDVVATAICSKEKEICMESDAVKLNEKTA